MRQIWQLVDKNTRTIRVSDVLFGIFLGWRFPKTVIKTTVAIRGTIFSQIFVLSLVVSTCRVGRDNSTITIQYTYERTGGSVHVVPVTVTNKTTTRIHHSRTRYTNEKEILCKFRVNSWWDYLCTCVYVCVVREPAVPKVSFVRTHYTPRNSSAAVAAPLREGNEERTRSTRNRFARR